MDRSELKTFIDDIIKETFKVLTKVYPKQKESNTNFSEIEPPYNSLIVFPETKKDNEDKTEDRISEQELRFIFVEQFNKYVTKENNLFYSIETPTRKYYDFSGPESPRVVPKSEGTGRAANIDLLNDQGKDDIPIASVNFSLFGLDSDVTYDNEDVFLFLSSSSNPFDSSASEFRFVHKDVGFGEAITDSNSIGYKIRAVPDFDAMKSADSIEGITEVTYYGADYLTVDGTYPDVNQRMHTACYKEELGDMFGGGSVHWHSYSGTLYLELDTNNVIMDEGLYRSTVYVHVVTDENISKRGEATA